MNEIMVLLALVGLLALLAGLFAVLAWRAAAGAPARLSLTLDKLLAGGRAEAETTRAILAATEGRLNVAIQAGTTDALSKAFAQITGATQDMAHAVEALRRAAGEDSQKVVLLLENRLAAIQNSVNEKLHEAVEQQMTSSFARVIEQFAQVQLAMGEVQSAAAQVGDLKRIFSNVSTRGGWGEAQLGAMLEQVLPPGSFERNFVLREATRERVDFALRMPSREKLWLAVDSKFPTEDYARLLDAAASADFEGERKAREGLAARIRLEARKIREKYICPPDTVDFGVMYLPSDGLFAEVARMPGVIDEVRSKEKVMILGPSLLPALLQTIHLGHITLDLDQRAGEIGKLLSATRGEMIKMDDALLKLANSATTMSNNIENVRKRNRVMKKVLEKVELVEGGTGQVLLGLGAEEEE
jgi:DNA recombination protein RmuC